ncbi:MAG: M14 family zinc carboxypeptidase [Bacteroidota bacterium]
MKSKLSILFLLLGLAAFGQNYSKCKIFTDSKGLKALSDLGIPVDHGVVKKDSYFISDFSEAEIRQMKEQGFKIEILVEDVVSWYKERSANQAMTRNSECSQASSGFDPQVPAHFELGSMGGYFTYQEFLDELDEMQQLYPDLITVKAPIANFQTHEGRPIYWVRISDFANTDETEPEVLYTALHHAREPASLSTTLFYMWYLLENYAGSPEIQHLVNDTEIYFVPMINPDGYIENQVNEPNGGGMWRKNKRNNGNGTTGVDLNRNYSYEWGTTGIDFDSNSDIYPGPNSFSEPETQAIKWLCENRDFVFAFNAHTYGNLMLFPIGSATNEFAEDHDYLQALGSHMVQYSGFIAQKSSALYPASGDSDDYMYLEDLAIKPEIFAYTPEIGSDADGFWPAQSDIISICQGMVFSNLALSHAAHNYWVIDETDPTSVVAMSGDFHYTLNRLGIVNDPVSVSIEPLTGILSVGTADPVSAAQNVLVNDSISFVLQPSIQVGDPVVFVLVSDFGAYSQRDTIYKVFGNPTVQFVDEADNTNNWTGGFALTSEAFYTPGTSFADSPNGEYQNFNTESYELNETVDLTHAMQAKVEFYARWAIEDNYDYARLEVSTDDGNTWIGQCGQYTNAGVGGNGGVQPAGEPVYDGFQLDWVLEEISLSSYLGQPVKLRFVMKSDMGVREDGFYFDDFKVLYDVDNAGLQSQELPALKLFPNPAASSLTLSNPKGFHQSLVKIVDLQGKTLRSLQLNSSLKSQEIEINGLPNGVYFLEMEQAGEVSRTKFSVIR